MTLDPGARLSHYEVLSRIGAGGMGEVYRARDTRLDREVAIKVLPADFAKDADRLHRFAQEARATSALNHPNILTVYDIGTDQGSPFLVAELLEGEELRATLNEGAIPPRKAIEYALQIVAGLAAAHDRGIVHRDLKPENLFITKDERVKILDFGLAKLRPAKQAAEASSEVATQRALTDPGVVMGTVGYMSPEQVRGKEADYRADIFSFGMILYEMLSGRRAFGGESLADVMSAILKEEPPELAESGVKIAPGLEKIVRRCLAKKPEHRFHSAHDLGFALEAVATPTDSSGSKLTEAAQALEPAAVAKSGVTAQHSARERMIWAVGALALAAVAGALLFWMIAGRSQSPATTSRSVKRVTIKLPDAEPLALAKFGPLGIGRTAVALSPDGSLLVYAAERNGKSQLFQRALSQFDARPMPGTEGANSPFFSPDGRSLGFFSENKLKKVSLQGGEPVTVCEARIPHGATWGTDDTIVLADSEGLSLSRVSASGGNKEVLPNKSADRAFFPQFLPGDKAVLYSTNNQYSPDYGKIVVLTLATGEGRVVLEGGTNPRYSASGHLVFARAGAILAAPFDVSRLEVTGPAVTLIEGIRIEEWGAAQFALSSEGTLVYVNGGPAWIGKLTWVDQQGISKPLAVPPQAYGPVSISPDGKRLAVAVAGSTSDLWVYDLTRGTFNRLTVEGSNFRPLWTPDGKRIVYYRVNGPNQFQLVSQVADGSDLAEVLITSKYLLNPSSWSPDGKVLAIQENSADTGFDLLMLPLEGDRQPIPWLKTKFNEWGPVFSVDGKWITYVSDESGTYEVYVRPYPGPGGKRQISTNGGEEVLWSRDGSTLFYRNALTWMSVAVQTQPEFRADAPKVMFEGPYLNVPGLSYDVAADGKHFMMIEENQKQAPTTQLNVVLNWFEELKR